MMVFGHVRRLPEKAPGRLAVVRLAVDTRMMMMHGTRPPITVNGGRYRTTLAGPA